MENLRIATWDIKNSYFKLWENNIKAACVTQLLTEHNLDVLDVSREEIVLNKAKERIKNKDLEEYYLKLVVYLFVQPLYYLKHY